MDTKLKFSELLDDLNYYLIRTPRDWYYNFIESVKSIFKRLPYVIHQRDFDYGFVLTAELQELIILRDGILKYRNHVNWKRDVETLNTAIRMIKEINNVDEYGFFMYDKRYVNDRNLRRFMNNEDQFCSYQKFKDKEVYRCMVRECKIWYLYHRYREFYMRRWWD